MKRQFSKEELHGLRTSISIGCLIERGLKLPSKLEHGISRFRCPVCGEFHCRINHHVNLARCFNCARNFNSIDIVMLTKKTSFTQSVMLLKQYQEKTRVPASRRMYSANCAKTKKKQHVAKTIAGNNRNLTTREIGSVKQILQEIASCANNKGSK